MKKQNLNENFVCRIWEEQSYYSGLETTAGEKIEILDIGHRNFDAGPDFKNSRLRIGGKIYYGSVEIHKTLKDWHAHKHSEDGKYNDVILHVVFYNDEFSDDLNKEAYAKSSRLIPTLILSEFISRPLKEIWNEIINSPSESFLLPCYPEIKEIPHLIVNDFLERLGTERLFHRAERMKERLNEISGNNPDLMDWEQLFFECICEALGFSKNKKQFLKLAGSVQFAKIKKMKPDIIRTDSLLFGISGFLYEPNVSDIYIENLKSIWSVQKEILKPPLMDKSEWNFFRLRPANFPTLRISYASAILNEIINNEFLKKIIMMFQESTSLYSDLEVFFKSVNNSDYWKTHYNFGKSSGKSINAAGTERIGDIITNVILPLVYLYSVTFKKENILARVLYFFKKEKIKNRGNEVIRIMKEQTGKPVITLSDEQSLIQLHNFYCVHNRCMECEMGKIVLGKKKVTEPMKIIIY